MSGPISSTLDARIAGRITRQQGYFDNVAPNPAFLHSPGTRESAIRLSLNWRPIDRLTVKLRGTYDYVHEHGSYSTSQKASCPTGVSRGGGALPGTEDCKLNEQLVYAPFPSAAARAVTGNPDFDSDQPYSRVSQQLFVADAAYELTDSLTLSSVSGYYRLRQRILEAQTTGARFFIGGLAHVQKDTFSQELRLAYSSPDSPLDVMIGGFYQHDLLKVREAQAINQGTIGGPDNIRPLGFDLPFRLPSRAYSAFAQAGFKFTDALSLSAGIRYSRDVKRQSVTTPPGIPNKFAVRERIYKDVSPEVTVSFKPNENTNFFASFKEGYKSGAYQVGSNPFTTSLSNPAVTSFDNSYRPETVRGFEGGLKVRLFDRQLRLNMAAYTYLYKDLQVTFFNPTTITQTVLNASSARVKGVEGDFSFTPRSVPGLTITGAASYNHSRYASTFFSTCYVGQRPVDGCTRDSNGDGIPDQQNMIGRPTPRAPNFSGSIGFTYEMPVGESSKLTLNANAIYTSGSFVTQELTPVGTQPRRVLVDAGVAFGSQSGSYELAFIGRNLTNRYYVFSGFQTPGTGGGTGTAAGVLADFEGFISRGRELWMRLTIRPSAF